MATLDKKLLPFRDYDEHDVTNEYALDANPGTGLAGLLVKVSASDLDQQSYWAANSPVGNTASSNVISNFFQNANRVGPTTSGDSKWTALGITLVDVRTVDGNGIPLYLNKRQKDELAAVYSGQTVSVARKGRFRMRLADIEGVPTFGSLIVPASGTVGGLAAVLPSQIWTGAAGSNNITVTKKYNPEQVLGKWISNTGSRQGGYADFILDV